MLPISLTPTSMTTRWNSSLFTDDDIPVLGVVLDALAKDQLIYVVLYVATNDSQHGSCGTQYMSVSDDQFLSFLHGHLLCFGLLLFSFRLLFSPFPSCS